jgi:ADP-ribose pyrophosphatase YjhB (NUDIX family)
MGEKIGVRPCAVLIEDEKVLCISCKYEDGEYFLFPGGGLEAGETMGEAAVREMFEETGLIVDIKKLIYVNDWIKDRKTNTRVLNMFFLVERKGGDIIPGEKDNGKVKEIKWVLLKHLKELDLRPAYVAERLHEDYKKGFPTAPYFN